MKLGRILLFLAGILAVPILSAALLYGVALLISYYETTDMPGERALVNCACGTIENPLSDMNFRFDLDTNKGVFKGKLPEGHLEEFLALCVDWERDYSREKEIIVGLKGCERLISIKNLDSENVLITIF